MSGVTDEILDHDYDGIQEYDNPLPRWWLYLLYGSILWAIGYLPYYHYGPGALPEEALETDMQAWYQLHPPVQLPDEAAMLAFAEQDGVMERGAATYKIRCLSCHAADGGGLVGPNLTDEFSIHGQRLEQMIQVVYHGVPAKGMLSWKTQLSLEEIKEVTVYVHSLRGTTPAKPKAPQGDPIVDGDTAEAAATGATVVAATGEAAPAPTGANPATGADAPSGVAMAPTGEADAPPEGESAAPVPAESAGG